MAKTSMKVKDKKRNESIAKSRESRAKLAKGLKNGEIGNIAELTNGRGKSVTRIKNRCTLSGRPRGYIGYFGISRTLLRDIASAGLLPGLKKS